MWIAWIKPSWKFTAYDINSDLFAHTVFITINLDQIEHPAKLEAKNDLGVYDISDKKLHFLMVVAWVQVTLIFPIILTDCLEYPTTLTSPQGFNSKFPFNFWLSWSYTFNGIAFTSAPVSCLPCISTPSISIFEKIWVGRVDWNWCLTCWGR